MSDVVVVQRVLPHYRVPFFEGLAAALDQRGHALRVVFGQEYPGEVPVTVNAMRPWGVHVRNRYIGTRRRWLAWQALEQQVQSADLIIVEQSNRSLANLRLLARLGTGTARLAYWGHGRNHQARNRRTLSERVKRMLATHVDWWFTYTQEGRQELESLGFPTERITAVENTIDGAAFLAEADRLRALGLPPAAVGTRVRTRRLALYCGGLYTAKRIDFLIAAADRIRARVPDFELAIVGDGPDAPRVHAAAAQRPWIHVLGALHGDARVPWFLASRVQLMPGLVGLAVIDSFLSGTPLLTTDISIHSPEIAYLQNGVNGVMAANELDRFVDEAIRLLTDEGWHRQLAAGCAASARRYTLDNMIGRFADGVSACVEDRPVRSCASC